jgi:hypothetical protein
VGEKEKSDRGKHPIKLYLVTVHYKKMQKEVGRKEKIEER